MQACTMQISIARPWREVCGFLAEPRHYARWASWIGPSLRQRGGEWSVRRPRGGWAKVRFSERNAFGVADHWLLEDEDHARLVALRALPHGEGCEVLLTLFREHGSDEAAWARQLAAAQQGLQQLCDVVDGGGAAQRADDDAAPPAGPSPGRPAMVAARSRARIALTAASQRPSAQRPCMPASS